MSFSESRMSRDYGIDFGGYDNDGSNGTSQEAFLEDRIEAMRYADIFPGAGMGDIPALIARFGIPAATDAAARMSEARARVQIAQAQSAGSFAGSTGRTYTTPVSGAPLGANMPQGSGMLLMLAAVVAGVVLLAKD